MPSLGVTGFVVLEKTFLKVVNIFLTFSLLSPCGKVGKPFI